MPEGHTLHRLAGLHTQRYVGAPVEVSSPQGRGEGLARAVDGRVLESARAHGKHLFHRYGVDRVVHVHLGLYGRFSDEPMPVTPPRGQVRLRMIGATHWADLRGPTKCELLTEERYEAITRALGPDPLRADADPDQVWARISRSRTPIAVLLMDQSVLAGVGNIYRAELLFRHGLDPSSPGSALGRDQWEAMWADLVTLMRAGVRTGRIDTVRPEHEPTAMGRPPRRDRHGGETYVYRRAHDPCLVCRTPIRLATLAGRTLYWCPTCQPAA